MRSDVGKDLEMKYDQVKKSSYAIVSFKRIFIFFAGILVAGYILTATAESAEEKANNTNHLVIHADEGKYTISRNIYGHFSEHLGGCIYGGFWVGEDSPIPNTRGIRNDVIEALRKIRIPVLRWPGGCFADEYHWKEGIGPRKQRPAMINTHWGMVKETNAFGTHEFMDLCEQLGCEAYIAGNVGSGTVEEMQDWVEYMTSDADSEMANLRRANGRDKPWRVKYFGIGNENWGCGGNMTPEYYADLYNRFQTYVRNYSGNEIVKVACGPGSENYHWIRTVLEHAGRRMDAISLHHYVRGSGNWTRKGSATDFDEKEWFALMKNTLTIYPLLKNNIEIMDEIDPRGRIDLFVDEWGTWWDTEPGTNPAFLYQQNTLRDAVSCGIFLNAFNKNCRRVRMANIAQTINVLQAMILTKGEKMILTPTYHVFEMYKVHQDATMLPIDLECSDYQFGNNEVSSIDVSTSKDKSGKIHVSLCNLNPSKPADVSCKLLGIELAGVSGRVLTADDMTAHNTFDKPETVKPVAFNNFSLSDDMLKVELPAKSVVVLEIW
jgi:alpha-N-arabinofuranosidase